MMKASDVFLLSLPLQVWNTNTGEELLTLEGHRNVVYAIAFNNPYGDKIITGSFGALGRTREAKLKAHTPAARAIAQTKRASCGTQTTETSIIRTAATRPRSSAFPSTRTAQSWRRDRWTTLRGCGMLKRATSFTRSWVIRQK